MTIGDTFDDVKVPDTLKPERLVLRRHHMKDVGAFTGFLADPTATAYMAFTPEQRTRFRDHLLALNVIPSCPHVLNHVALCLHNA